MINNAPIRKTSNAMLITNSDEFPNRLTFDKGIITPIGTAKNTHPNVMLMKNLCLL